MADTPLEGIETDRFDGSVGTFDDSELAPEVGMPEVSLWISVGGDVASEAHTMGLAEDVRFLVHAFVRPPAPVDRDATRTRPPRSASTQYENIDIALHGLELGPDALKELRDHIRDLVSERMVQRETER